MIYYIREQMKYIYIYILYRFPDHCRFVKTTAGNEQPVHVEANAS